MTSDEFIQSLSDWDYARLDAKRSKEKDDSFGKYEFNLQEVKKMNQIKNPIQVVIGARTSGEKMPMDFVFHDNGVRIPEDMPLVDVMLAMAICLDMGDALQKYLDNKGVKH